MHLWGCHLQLNQYHLYNNNGNAKHAIWKSGTCKDDFKYHKPFLYGLNILALMRTRHAVTVQSCTGFIVFWGRNVTQPVYQIWIITNEKQRKKKKKEKNKLKKSYIIRQRF